MFDSKDSGERGNRDVHKIIPDKKCDEKSLRITLQACDQRRTLLASSFHEEDLGVAQ
jgi:hypothetical protein